MTDARPVVLLPGWSVAADAFVRLTASDDAVVVADFAAADSPAAFVTAARAAIAACPTPPIVLGWSLGALVALEVVSEEAEAVHSLSLISAPDRFVRHGAADLPGWSPRVLERMDQAIDDDRAGALGAFDAALFSDDDRTAGVPARWTREPGTGAWPDAALHAGLAYLRTVQIDPATVAVPVSLFHGGSDPICPLARAERLADGLAEVTLTVVPGAGHAPFLSDSERFLTWRAATVLACG